MKQFSEKQAKVQETRCEKDRTSQKEYHKPLLKFLGDLRSLTLSGSPGVLDSDLASGNPGEV